MKIKEIAEVINGSTPSTKHQEYYGGNIVWITPKDLADLKGKYIYKGSKNITEKGFASCSTKIIPPNNILMTSRAPIGLISINKVECCTNQGFKSLIVDKSKCDVEFLYYYLKSHIKEIEILGSGTTFKEVSKTSIENYEIKAPSLEKQKAIAGVLKSIDSKIILNNEINKTLRNQAEMLFNHWFIQFDFLNEEGKPYKSSGGRMTWNEKLKREIPDGWDVNLICDCIQHINTGLNPRDNFVLNDGDIKYITVKNITNDSTLDFSECDTISKETKHLINKRSMIDKGDILFASIAPLGRCYLIQETPIDWEINESVFSIRPNYKKVCSEYLFQFFTSAYFVKKAEHSSTGSIFNGIRISTLQSMPLLVPPKNMMDEYKRCVSNAFSLINILNKENERLSSLRDFLLPMLMNGQVRILD